MLRIAASHYRLPRALPAVAFGGCLCRLPRALPAVAFGGFLRALPVVAFAGCLWRPEHQKKALIAESLIIYIKTFTYKTIRLPTATKRLLMQLFIMILLL